MTTGEAVLWTVGALVALTILVFVAIFVRFVGKAAVSYLKHRPYAAIAAFGIPGGIASFATSWFGGDVLIAVLVGLIAGLAVFLLLAMELGAD
jgi:hypothetical protein